MNVTQLQKVLQGFEIGEDLVTFGGLPNEAFVIEEFDGGWRVFYSERGIRTSETWYSDESEAVDCLIMMLARDTTLRMVRR